jgi:hypothetical protein
MLYIVRRLTLLLVLIALSVSVSSVYHTAAASGASISFVDSSDQPEYQVTASNLVDDAGGCDFATVLMTDATGSATDIDNMCLEVGIGVDTEFTDWGSIENSYVPTLGPITYTIYDTAFDDVCYANENSFACYAYLLSGAVPCIGEGYYTPAGLTVGAGPVRLCGGGSVAVSGCFLNVPAGSVVGDAPFQTQVYYEPGNIAPGVLLNPGTYIVVGQDKSETYYKIVLACKFVWVEKSMMQPSYLPPQNGTPLPTRIVQ